MENFEIEHKFLVCGEFKTSATQALRIRQGYLCADSVRTVRVRTKGDRAFITVKGRPKRGETGRFEWEKEISVGDAESLLALAEPGQIDKTRYIVPAPDGHVWEVDEFHGLNDGLVIAEVELGSENEKFGIPEWAGEEVTEDHRYYNSYLCSHPYSSWKK